MVGSADRQGELWGRAPLDWADVQETFSVPLWQSMLDSLVVAGSSPFLDAGCGAGGASVLARERTTSVSGLDASVALIEVAKRRVPDGDFRAGALEALPFDDRTFEDVLAASSVQYAADPVAALRELSRVATEDGRVAVGLFSTPDKVDYAAVFDVIRSALPDPPSGGGPFALSAPGTLEELIETAGMDVAEVGEADCPFLYPDIDTFWRASISAGPVQAALDVVDAAALRPLLEQAVEPYQLDDGSIRFEVAFRYVTATNI